MTTTSSQAEWTFIIYMAVTPELVTSAKNDIAAVAAATIDPRVNVVIEVAWPDRTSERIRFAGGAASREDMTRDVDTGDPNELTAFIDWALDACPAKRSALVVWGHGGGWEDVDVDPQAFTRQPRAGVLSPSDRIRAMRAVVARTLAHDSAAGTLTGDGDRVATGHTSNGSRDYLTDIEFRSAIESTARGRVDLLGCDACQMGMIEIAYEMKDVAGVLVASEAVVPVGWPYEEILSELSANPGMSAHALGVLVVHAYAAGADDGSPSAMAAFDQTLIEPLAASLDDAISALTPLISTKQKSILAVREATTAFEKTEYIDLDELCRNLTAQLGSPALNGSLATVRKRLAAARCANFGAPSNTPYGAIGGLSIFFPPKPQFYYEYGKLRFAAEHRWGGFLRALLGST